MLSYQHAFHAGNLADVHKHAALAWTLEYLTRKPKPLSYLETHAGRALYDLTGPEATRTGEAAQGISRVRPLLDATHPYARVLDETQAGHGPSAYPGSPMIARLFLRQGDRMTLAERHPAEAAALRQTLPQATIRETDGPALALSLAPPDPRRGLVLIDPSYELKNEWQDMPALVRALNRKWNVGIVMLWYPVLSTGAHVPLTRALSGLDTDVLHHEVRFAPARPGHRMVGSGLFIVNPPWGMAKALSGIADLIGRVSPVSDRGN